MAQCLVLARHTVVLEHACPTQSPVLRRGVVVPECARAEGGRGRLGTIRCIVLRFYYAMPCTEIACPHPFLVPCGVLTSADPCSCYAMWGTATLPGYDSSRAGSRGREAAREGGGGEEGGGGGEEGRGGAAEESRGAGGASGGVQAGRRGVPPKCRGG
eukprot:74798-Rhodomonas_salina.2